MRYGILFLCLFGFCIKGIAVPDHDQDTNRFLVVTIDIGNCSSQYYQGKSHLYYFDSREEVDKLISVWNCEQPELPEGMDFSKNDLLLIDYHGMDCKSTFSFEARVDSTQKTYTFVSSVTYGGCRAGGNYFHAWVLIPKIENGYTVQYARRLINTLAKTDELNIEKTYSKR